MNRARRTAHLYEMGQGYAKAVALEERRQYGWTDQERHSGRRFKVRKKRWYHSLWDYIEDFFSSSDIDSQRGGSKKKKVHRAGTKEHWRQHRHKVRNFSRRRM